MPSPAATSYDEVPYDARPRYATHPDCLATLARLLGMSPAPVERCRVLELGCSTGGNLLPLAEALPQASFVGVDLSERQIDTGRRVAAALGLKNLRLEARSILDVDPSFGEFDYVVAHGVYSWVPPVVRDKILAVCKANLAPQGVAYVSYNTLPGWYLRAGARDLMNYHTRDIDGAEAKVAHARMILDFLQENTPDRDGAWGKVLKDEADLIRPEGDYYVYHEHLEAENHPVYFTQFMEHAGRHGLQFLGEAELHTSLSVYPAEVQQVLRRISPDLISLEQYLDYLKNRTFRRTLLVHDTVKLTRTPGPEVAQTLLAVGLARPVSERPEVTTTKTEEFVNDAGSTVSTNVPFAKAALVALFEGWPRPFAFDELWSAVRGRIGDAPEEQGRAMLARSLVHLYLSGLVGLHTHLAPFTLSPGDRPRATGLARLQARTGARVTNLRHKTSELEVFDRAVLSLCDGGRDRAAMVEALAAMVAAGDLGLKRDGRELADGAEVRAALREGLEESLARLGRSLLLL
jgi:methyltransferase-like protein/predicted O-methyltransferase YrrM